MIRRITALLLSLCVFTLCAAACPIRAYAEDGAFDFENYTARTECIVLCVYEGKSGSENSKFRAVRMLKGNIDGKYFYVTNTEGFGKDLKTGSKYVLYLDKTVSVYYPRDIFTPEEDVYLTADGRNNITGIVMSGSSYGDFRIKSVSALAKYTESVKSECAEEYNYIRSSDFETIYEGSAVIVKAKVTRRTDEFSEGVGLYECTLTSNIKGSMRENFSAFLFDNKVREGNEYYFLFDGKTDKGIYVLSSKRSIYGPNDPRFR